MRQELFQGTLRTAKAMGLFFLARLLTSSGLRILCYHGFALGDEYRFRGKLFVREEFFRSRMELLKKNRFAVLPLGEAVEKLKDGSLPRGAVVVTIDDGWLGVHTRALRVLKEMNIPATLYVVTEYIAHPMPVFSVTVSYLFWESAVTEVTLPRGLGHVHRGEPGVSQRVTDYGLLLEHTERFAFLRELADALNVDFKRIDEQRLFQMLSDAEVGELAEAGVDIQLHTHHHEWPIDDRVQANEEILLNRSYLARLVSTPLIHFCYPSGVYHERQIPWLKELGIVTATTLLPGLNFRRTPPHELRRILDGEPVSQIEFEAEMSGFMELLRRGRSLLWGSLGKAFSWRDSLEHLQ
jgi:peptidoglycan/xylan/chitin deacetylase (PgdA/CDA1 family)